MSADHLARLGRGHKATLRDVARWAAPARAGGLSHADGPAYQALVDTLLRAMVDVGPTDATVGIVALTKVLALMTASTLRFEDVAKVAEICAGQGNWLENEVMALRRVVPSQARREG